LNIKSNLDLNIKSNLDLNKEYIEANNITLGNCYREKRVWKKERKRWKLKDRRRR